MIDARLQSEAVLDGRFGARVEQTPAYVSPFGKIPGLRVRLAAMRKRLVEPGGPFIGLGPIADLDLIMKLLNLREYAEWLVANGTDEQVRWGREILDLDDDEGELGALCEEIERVVPVAPGQEYGEAVGDVAKKALQFDLVRAVLENSGALDPGDEGTDVPALIRALLS